MGVPPIAGLVVATSLIACSPPATTTAHKIDPDDEIPPDRVDEHPLSSFPGAALDNSMIEPRDPAARNN